MTQISYNVKVLKNYFYFKIKKNYINANLIVRFVDIGGIVDHHCLNFLFIKWYRGSCRNRCRIKRKKKRWFIVQRNIMEANSKTINIYEMNKDRMCF
jgi:hypothetical protein